MADFIRSVEENGIVLNNVHLQTMGTISFELSNLFGRGIHQGDPGPNDHPIDSTISQESHQGGIGTRRYKGDDSRGNSWWSTLWMQTTDNLSLHPKSYQYVVAGEENNFAYVHDQLGGYQFATFGKKIKRWNESLDIWEDPGAARAFTGNPVAGGVTWGDATDALRLYVPMGSTYEVFDGTGVPVAGLGGEGAIGFVVWNEKLFKVDSTGAVKVSVNAQSGSPVVWTPVGQIPSGLTPRGMFVFYDRGNNQVIHVVTDKYVYALDYTNKLLVETDLWFPQHPQQGYGFTRWRADAYVSVGLGIQRQSNGLISAVGLDGRDGLPSEYSQGWITSLAPSYNELLALVRGSPFSFTPSVETADAGTGPPEGMYSQDAPNTYAMLAGYNGLGWGPKWIGDQAPTNLVTASTEGVYRIFWGTRGAIWTQQMPMGYYNPAYTPEQLPLERSGVHYTPWYNWGMTDTPKIMKYLEMKTEGCGGENSILVEYQIDEEYNQWVSLATILSNGQHRMRIGYESIGGQTLHVGLKHERIRFRFTFTGDPANDYDTPIIKWYTLVGRKWMRTVYVFSFQIDASKPHNDLSGLAISNHIYATARKKGGVPLVIADRVFIVDITTDRGNIEPGMTWNAIHNITAVEMVEEDNE